MRRQITWILLLGAILSSLLSPFSQVTFAATQQEDVPDYTTLRDIDRGTFNEYRYKMTQQFYDIREYFQVNEELNVTMLQNLASTAGTAYKYLPDDLQNENYYRELLIQIKKGVENPSNTMLYNEIVKALGAYIESTDIPAISGTIEIAPQEGNAPMTTTFRAKMTDPSGTQILSGNYTWWIDVAGQKVVIGRGPSINYTFREEGTFSVFLDVTSSHKNANGYTDVLPYQAVAKVVVKEKIASLIVKVNGNTLNDTGILKFTPEDANYGLLFDATSSTPTGGAKFTRTEWDFGNGVVRKYSGSPNIERIRYGNEGEYDVSLKMTTNEGKTIEKNFVISIRDPIATIEVNRQDGYIGDKFTFSAQSSGLDRNLTYSWEVVDIDTDTIIAQKSDKVFTYAFTKKGKYNVKLKVRRSSGEIDQDTRIVYVTSQSPIAEFQMTTPLSNKPNRVFFDASRSYDPDYSDDAKLSYAWYVDGERVLLEEPQANGSLGYYTFSTIGNHTVNLEVTDPDSITATKKLDINIDSILSVELNTFPRVIQRNNFIKFVASAPEAEVFEWDFGDGQSQGGSFDSVTHTYTKSGSFTAKLKVTDKGGTTNTISKTVYVSESESPYALISVSRDLLGDLPFDSSACGAGAYVTNRIENVTFNADDSINIDGQNTGLEYSWKIGNGKFSSASSVTHRFDEQGCFPVKLSVKSTKNGATASQEVMVEVRNMAPTLSSVGIQIENPEADPLIVRVNANGASDPDGVIQSYMWYYYTDTDTEPQDFRSTSTPSTSFVLPKITGNYYFVAILKDNNEARVTSEQITGSRYFTTITGDNINTPIVDLSVDDNSLTVGQEVTFTAKATNILGQSIDKEASYSWDFDGDGFYDTQSSEPTMKYVYRKSGEFYAKVKVKYRGISSTKNVTVNVSNKLVADFDYISIGNTFIFFDSSSGEVDKRVWDLGDGTTSDKSYFTHEYTDNVNTHTVTLKISEGGKTEQVQKNVTKNIKNILKSRGEGLVYFTSPEVDADGAIMLDSPSQSVHIYMGEGNSWAAYYAIDYDTENDSDLNGGSDDDQDNKGTASYTAGDIMQIPLSAYRNQKVRVFTLDSDGKVLASANFEIVKEYIEDVQIDPDMIVFEGVTESEKEKIEELKTLLGTLPQQQRLESLNYVKKLQENWNDATEKTRTILDFENYIFQLQLENEDVIISLLESLLVEGQEDQSAKQITYQALVNLIPQDISCQVEWGSCYDNLISKITDIRESNDVEYNKTLGTEVLKVIETTDLMTNQQKLDFKAILTSLVYGGDVTQIPEDDMNDVINQPDSQSVDEGSGGVLSFVFTILKYIAYLLIIFLVLVAGYYLVYFLFFRKNGSSFTDFVNKTTKRESPETAANSQEENFDVFADMDTQSSNTSPEKVDPLAQASVVPKEEKPSTPGDEVPDWLKGSFEKTQTPVTKSEPIASEVQETERVKEQEAPASSQEIPDWLKGSDTLGEQAEVSPLQDTLETQEVVSKEQQVEEKEELVSEIPKEDLETLTQIDTSSSVPDWLKGSIDESETPKAKVDLPEAEDFSENMTEVVAPDTSDSLSKEANITEEASASSENDFNLPDWLKADESEDTTLTQEEIVPNPLSDTAPKAEKKGAEKSPDTSAGSKKKNKTSENKKSSEVQNKTSGAEKKNSKTKKTDEELWDDGMKIPDWLKSESDS